MQEEKMKEIIEYIKLNYDPLTLIVYGSYADGSHNLNSDFDALVVSKNHEVFHDTSFVAEVQLDVFVYPFSYFETEVDYNEFLQIFDGKIIFDTDDFGAMLKNRVISYMDALPYKTREKICTETEWCKKMLLRVKRCDTEGMFRWHWLLVDSLEIFCDVVEHRYLGPKKTLKWMENSFPEAYEKYRKALSDFSEVSLNQWILYLENMSLEKFLEYVRTGPEQGWPMRKEIYARCPKCNDYMSLDPMRSEVCSCGNLYKDCSAGRFGAKTGDSTIKLYKRKN